MNQLMHILLGTVLTVVIGVSMLSCAGHSEHMNTKDWVGHHRDELTTLRGLPSRMADAASSISNMADRQFRDALAVAPSSSQTQKG